MTPLLYLAVASISASLATRAWWLDQREPARQAYLGLGWSMALAYGFFGLSLFPGLSMMRHGYMLCGTLVPAMTLWAIDRLFARSSEEVGTPVMAVFASAVVIAPLTTIIHIVFYADVPRSSPPEVAAGVFAFVSFGVALWRLWLAHEAARLEVEQVRLRYLLAVLGLAVLFTLFEHLARNLAAPVDPTGLTFATRSVALQGAVPPFSVVLGGLGIYLMYHIVVMYRLLDLHELMSRMATLLISALMLLLVDAVTFLWVDTFANYPFHSTFQVFLASLLFLAAYEPAREYIQWGSSRLFNQRGQRLAEALSNLERTVPTVISADALTDTLLSRLNASGRVPVCSVYLWNPRLDAFTIVDSRGQSEGRPLKAVAARPFTDGFKNGARFYTRQYTEREAVEEPELAERLALMDAMHADLTVPFVHGGIVLGWLQLRDETWSDGYSVEEIQRITTLAELTTVVLSNIQDFEVLQEEKRLAALGAMAAGLAHEIRNPLAGVKGAAQYLQSEELDEDASEMLNVILDEANRLDAVVTQFLDYARPYELQRSPGHVNAVVTHVLTLLRAQQLPEGIEIYEALSGELPNVPLDSNRIRQVLLNLAQNALQAMPEGGRLSIETRRSRLRNGDPAIEIAVRDTGDGIEPEALDNLFIPFFTTKKDGTGLGLPICQRIVQAHSGELEAQSVQGLGATFIVRLPISDEPSPAATPVPAAG